MKLVTICVSCTISIPGALEYDEDPSRNGDSPADTVNSAWLTYCSDAMKPK